MSNKNQVQFAHGRKKTRGELRLPQLHFVAVDQWVKVLGNQAFVAWLQFYSWADRKDQDRECDAIPTSMRGIAQRLNVSRTTLYNLIIRPLWNYGLIDLVETPYDGYSNVNIVVYEYPQNDPSLATKELNKIRDYDTEYISAARQKAIQVAESREKSADDDGPKNGPGGRSKKWTGGAVQKMDRGGPIIGHNNYKDKSFNDLELKQQQESVAVIAQKIEFALGISIKSLMSKLPEWLNEYGSEMLIEKAQYIGAHSSKWQNVIGTYRASIEQKWDTAFAEVAATATKRDERYNAFYQLFPDA